MKKVIGISIMLLMLVGFSKAQVQWRNPLNEGFPVVQGQAQPLAPRQSYARLPDALKGQVRDAVWNLGQQSAGQYIEFKSDADKITVRYQVRGALNLPHMPTTGVSGVDLYVHTEKGGWQWAPGRFSFKDTVTYTFNAITTQPGETFRLYLPLYNGVKWLEIGIAQGKSLTFMPLRTEKPIVIYGTSIAQGGCASRAGLAWPSIMGRTLNRPVINLAFSGNGRLEAPIIELMNTVNASVFVLDCMPNLASKTTYPEEELRKRIVAAVTGLRAKHKDTPILLVAHSGGGNDSLIDERKEEFRRASAILTKIYHELKASDHTHLYHLSTAEIGMKIESTVDGVHPNDIGMMEHAAAFAKKIASIK